MGNSVSRVKLKVHRPRHGRLKLRSTQVDKARGPIHPPTKEVELSVPSTSQSDGGLGDEWKTFDVPDVASDATSTPTGLREDVLLLAWLIVLLRTREDSQASFDWVYKSIIAANEIKDDKPANASLSTDRVLASGLQTKITDALTPISQHINAQRSVFCASPGHTPISLVLSTGALCQASEVRNDHHEPVLHLETRLHNGLLAVRSTYRSKGVEQFAVAHYIDGLIETIRFCISSPTSCIQECLEPLPHDLDAIWKWNHLLPPTHDFCMHDLVSERARQFPQKVAIDSWDGTLTYDQIDRYSSSLAQSLVQKSGVGLHDFVPICFEKSRWTAVAVLAVMKAGATMVLMDPTLPLARLQNMAAQVDAKSMIASLNQEGLARSILPHGKVVVLGPTNFPPDGTQTPPPEPLPNVPTSALMYIIFTSGSTGTPKGVKISHQTYTSSAIPRAKAVGYSETSRVLDFASYAFDVSIDSMLLTLGNGGCLCIPSDQDRLNDINGVIRNMKINYAGITPSMARILDLDVISSLTGGLGLGGEAVSARDAALWGQHARIVIGYGPCECTIGCTINSSAATPAGRDYITIGPGNGAAIWIVNPDDHEKLVPVGAVGEILVEGPIVGQGYLNDPEKTAAAFIHDPSWLSAGHRGDLHPGRKGRLYKTGDLGRYAPDGSGEIVFVGRKDTQVKLRGQRVELGEIESQLKARLPTDVNVIAEVIVPGGSSAGGPPTLVAFISSQPANKEYGRDAALESVELPGELSKALSEADTDLAKVLPRYMVPTAYIPVNYMPTLISGKTDRKRLRLFGAEVSLRELQLNQANPSPNGNPDNEDSNREMTDMEQHLRDAWALILKLPSPDIIRINDNFFALGGDSLAAMKLVTLCRERGLNLSVTNTFANPTLSAMAKVISICEDVSQIDTVNRPPFSLVSEPLESALIEASQICGTEKALIEDLYPCTPTQESLFTFSLKSSEPYIAQRVARIPNHVDTETWKAAWETVIMATPILRTRLVQLNNNPSLLQVVVRETIDWKNSTNLGQYLKDDRNEKMVLGLSLARYAIVSDVQGGRYMVWTIHHAVYDGWSEPLLLHHVRDVLLREGQIPGGARTSSSMGDFVKYVINTDQSAMHEFWRKELEGAIGPQFPARPSRDFLPAPDTILEHIIPIGSITSNAKMPFTSATLIRAAWAIVASQHSGNDDVVFGETLTGRDIPLEGVESIAGPLIATVPVRVRINRASTVESYLMAVQQAILSRTPYQHMGMQNIRKVSRDAQYACEAPAGLVIQPEPDYLEIGNDLGFELGDVVREAIHFNPYSLMLACGIQKGGASVRVCASFDSSLIKVTRMQRILVQLEVACEQLSKNLSKRIDQITTWLPETELNKIWGWNRVPPLGWEEASRTVRADKRTKQGSVYPRMANPWVCDARNPGSLAPIGCAGELWLEGGFNPGGHAIDSPTWLMSGSSEVSGRAGKVHSTGDIVELRDDGTLLFLGRKEDMHHQTDLLDFECRLAAFLGSSILAAAALTPKKELVVFVQKPAEVPANIANILPEPKVVDSFGVTICANASGSLLVTLKRLDKFIQNTLASHMVPSAYIIVDRLPTDKENQVCRRLLAQVASGISHNTLDQIRQGFRAAWNDTTSAEKEAAQLSGPEAILRAFWARTLGISPSQIDLDDNFFRLGGDSVLAMKLVSSLRTEGHGMTVADIFRFMRLGDAAKALKVNQFAVQPPAPQRLPSHEPFSMLPGGSLDSEMFLTEFVRPQLASPDWSIQDVYPVTDSQALDVRGTIHAPRTSVQYTVLYFDKDHVDHKKLASACQELVKAHDILRTVFVEHQGSFLQVILKQLDDFVIQSTSVSTDSKRSLQQVVEEFCTAHIGSNDNYRLGAPFLSMSLLSAAQRQSCLVLGLSHAQYDGVSLPKLLEDLNKLYSSQQISPGMLPFSSYIRQVTQCDATRAQKYWTDLLAGSSLSVIGKPNPGSKAVFKSSPVDTAILPPLASLGSFTTATILTCAWAVVVARRLQSLDVTFGNITSGRGGMELEGIAQGPCYQFTPVRVVFESSWGWEDLLSFVQGQITESMEFDWYGFRRIREGLCGAWGDEVGARFYGSVVHSQGVVEEGEDEMEFGVGGRKCKVGILNPDGEAGWPIKIVSFERGGRTWFGVLGEEEEGTGFVEGVLEEVKGVLGEMVEGLGVEESGKAKGKILF
ncbi:nonribosomal siderophore peptide synthase Sid2 [Cladorrhinum samala]|uniref:Nonribosomal siderophore peptide synthase Sid2 n=1 Tax=Cladorrhinum samala TaxID=585594 RepID=A0AAV9HIA1_9PEZI|nr:nonribosomal siderophore peptide synthase Sid2 [Cladorrhinum samala]